MTGFRVPTTQIQRARLAAGMLSRLKSHIGSVSGGIDRQRQSLWGTMLHIERNLRRSFDGRHAEVNSNLAKVLTVEGDRETAREFLLSMASYCAEVGIRQAYCDRFSFLDEMRTETDSTRYLAPNPGIPARRNIRNIEVTEHYIDGYEKVLEARGSAGFHALIAIHNLIQGPALGGLRYFAYGSLDEALFDVKRLAEGMTMKSIICDDNLGGGKAVLFKNDEAKTERTLRQMGQFVNHLGGLYITAEDVGTREADMVAIRQETEFVTGLPRDKFPNSSGNPSPFTAIGTLAGIRATMQHRYGHQNLVDLVFAVQGVGGVGGAIAQQLLDAGARLEVSDIKEDALAPFRNNPKVTILGNPDAIFDVDAEFFVPAAMGAQLNANTIPRLRVKSVAGCANNQLQDPVADMARLQARGIVYVPDFVINAGGIINVSFELTAEGYDAQKSREKTLGIFHSVLDTLQTADRDGVSTREAAYRVGQRKLAAIEASVLKI